MANSKHIPLAEKLRPKSLDEVVGQSHLVGEEGFISRIIRSKKSLSIILWGPPGSGKTTIARLYAKEFSMRFVALSAVFSGINDLRKIIKEAEESPLISSSTLLFVDEIHRFNKSQQDAFLPFLEKGTIVLVGATTENPSFYLNDALLSRCRTLTLLPLDREALEKLLQTYENKIRKLSMTKEAREKLIEMAQGDGRYLLNMLENLETLDEGTKIDIKVLTQVLQKRSASYDKKGDQHYNLISALHKSVRGSDPDAALYWFTRILEGGEEPLFIARRLIRMAVEDIGLSDPQALPLTIAARDAYDMLGSPEGELALAEVVIYLALAPKSNATYTAYSDARSLSSRTTHLPPPPHILNAPTKLMKEIGYGKDYVYDHDVEDGFSGQNYFPNDLSREEFYRPQDRGFEREMKKRHDYFKKLREKKITG